MLSLTVHRCSLCSPGGPAFQTTNALQQHLRRKHGIRNELRQYVDGSGRCPVCKTQFSSRVHALEHLRETRRQNRCRTAVSGGQVKRLSKSTVDALDAHDRKCRREARQAKQHP
ncbi:unnamed protein product [Polarella glacialis]|uniref:C2H2-type domain-containing protein n=1 Tax=Polarella glacialis TaxID=89957 RepID=A0A813ISP4_POLGL|nr:unnamed protein product [Polarella glacialis]